VTRTVRRARPQSEWVSFSIPAIIDAATFEAAQEALRLRQLHAPRNRKVEYLFLNGRLRCGRCGRTMSGFSRHPGWRYYRCSSRFSIIDPALRCSHTLRADRAETEVWEAVARLLHQPDLIMAEVARQQATADEQRAAIGRDMALHEAALAKCEREHQRWSEAYAAEVINIHELKA
jgi:Recombinase zinc beta ribbon domain